MVDINLLGDDRQPDEQENTGQFNETFQEDSSQELTADSEHDFTEPDLDETLYGAYTQTSSKKAVYIVAGIVVVAALAVGAYYLFFMKKGNTQVAQNVVQKPIEQTQQPAPSAQQQQQPVQTQAPAQTQPTATQPTATPAATQTPPPPAVNVPPPIADIVMSNLQGVRTIEAILATMPQNVMVTLIQYRDGNFLTEVYGSITSNVAGLDGRIQQNLTNGSVKLLSRGSRPIQGREYQHALFQGNVSSAGGGRISPPNFMEVNQVRSAFRNFCQQTGMKLKEFTARPEISTSQFVKVPVMFKAVGTKDAALNFLNTVVSQNINVNFNKIVFTTPIRDFNNQVINLVLNMEIFQPTL